MGHDYSISIPFSSHPVCPLGAEAATGGCARLPICGHVPSPTAVLCRPIRGCEGRGQVQDEEKASQVLQTHTHTNTPPELLALTWSFLFLQALKSLPTAASPIPRGSSVQNLYIISQPVVAVSSQASCKCPTHSLCIGNKAASGILKDLVGIQDSPILGYCQVSRRILQGAEKETARVTP